MKFVVVMMYVVMVLTVGYLSMRKTKNVNDYFLGGRNVGPWLSAFAYGTTYFSAVLFIGYAGNLGWGFGLSVLWIVLGNTLIGTFLAWKILAEPTREMTTRLGTRTMPEFLAVRYQSVNLKLVSAAIIFVFLVPYSASVYMGLGYLFDVIFGIPFVYALIFMAVLTGAYLIMGGYFAVTLTDLIQGLIMIVGVIAMIYFIITHPNVGGVTEGISRLSALDSKLVAPVGPGGALGLFSLVILTSLGPWGLPQMVQKFYAIKSKQAISAAVVVSTIFALIISFGAYFTGAFGRLFFNNEMPLYNGVPNAELVMPGVLQMALPESLATLILLLVLAASMSTLASLVLVSSSAVVVDLMGTMSPKLVERKGMLLMRIFCGIFIVASVYLALKPNVIVNLMAISWGTIAGAFLAPYIYGLFWPRVTKMGAWAGVITSLMISIGFSTYTGMDGGMIPTIGCMAMIVPLFVVPVVSILTEKFEVSHLQQVFGHRKEVADYK